MNRARYLLKSPYTLFQTILLMIILPANRLRAVEEYYFSQKLRQIAQMNQDGGPPVINLGIGSPDQDPDASVIRRLSEVAATDGVHAYQSYQGIPGLRQAMADYYQRWFQVTLDPALEILPLMGSKEGIMHLSMAFLEAGDSVLIPDPGYPAYAAAASLAGATARLYALREENHWLPDLEALEAEGQLDSVKIMWVNYPHMPTGARANKAAFEALIQFAQKHKILLVNDLAYGMVLNPEHLSLLSVPGAMDCALELNSLSKSHHLAGWRIGMLCGRADYLNTVLKFKSNMDSGMFKPIQEAAIKALSLDQHWFDALNESYAKRKQMVLLMLQMVGIAADSNSSGLFVWGKPDGNNGMPPMDGYQWSDLLLEKARVFITPGGIFGAQGNPYIRVSLCANERTIIQAVERIHAVLPQLKLPS